MKTKFVIVEDTITEYLDLISNDIQEYAPRELKKLARLLVGEEENEASGYIAQHMSTTFNPFLFMSGQFEENWFFSNSTNPHNLMGRKNSNTIEIIYSGMELQEYYGDEARLWWEFAKDGDNHSPDRELERDYAYFQETGIDKLARSKDAKHKGAIAKGVKASKAELLDHSKQYLDSILHKHKGDIPPKVI